MLRAMWVVAGLLISGVALADDAAECRRARQAASLLVDVRANLRTNPAVAMEQLGVTVDEFESIAKALYYKWLEKHPEARRPAPPPAPQPVAQPAPRFIPLTPAKATDPLEGVSWWCFAAADSAVGDCKLTRAECNETRAKFLAPVRSTTPCDPLLTQQECDDIAVNASARVWNIKECEHQERVACFRTLDILDGFRGRACTPQIGMCKERRKTTLARRAHDVRVLSDCYIER